MPLRAWQKSILFALLLSAVFDSQARSVECYAGDGKRVIKTHYPVDDSDVVCKVTYRKFNQKKSSKTLWKARNDVNYCADRVLYLTAKLERAGWRCSSVYQPSPSNELSQSSITVNQDTDAELPTSPLEFRRFLQDQFEVDFQATADYHLGENVSDCDANSCIRIAKYLSNRKRPTRPLFGYKVSDETTLWIAPKCRGDHCWGDVYQQAKKIEALPLPSFSTATPRSLFLTSQNQGFPDLWLPVAHNSTTVHEVKILRYGDDGYKTLAKLLAKTNSAKQAAALTQSGSVTLTANFASGEDLELVYQTRDISNEALLLNPNHLLGP